MLIHFILFVKIKFVVILTNNNMRVLPGQCKSSVLSIKGERQLPFIRLHFIAE